MPGVVERESVDELGGADAVGAGQDQSGRSSIRVTEIVHQPAGQEESFDLLAPAPLVTGEEQRFLAFGKSEIGTFRARVVIMREVAAGKVLLPDLKQEG